MTRAQRSVREAEGALAEDRQADRRDRQLVGALERLARGVAQPRVGIGVRPARHRHFDDEARQEIAAGHHGRAAVRASTPAGSARRSRRPSAR